MCRVSLRAKLAQSAYNYLDTGKAPRRSDAVFVLAGRPERKTFGLKLWRIGYADRLILSFSGSECRDFADLDLESDGGMAAFAGKIAEKKRHFLLQLNQRETRCSPVPKGIFGTRSEARALATYLRNSDIRSLLVVSSPLHLRRAALTFRRAFRKSGISLIFIAVPETITCAKPAVRKMIRVELFKYAVYRLLHL